MKKLLILLLCLGIMNIYANSDATKEADTWKFGLMNATYLGFSLPDTLGAADTAFSTWVRDYQGIVNPCLFTTNIDINQYSTTTTTHKVYIQISFDKSYVQPYDSILNGSSVATWDSIVQTIPNASPYFRWYIIAGDSCILNDFGINTVGYGK